MDKTVLQELQEVLQDVIDDMCDNFCKYRDTMDGEGDCEWIRNGEKCPLDKI